MRFNEWALENKKGIMVNITASVSAYMRKGSDTNSTSEEASSSLCRMEYSKRGERI